jgi:hypothetical protein
MQKREPLMTGYDPLKAPSSEEWLDLDESKRMLLVEGYHRHARIPLPNARAHAVFHVIVENQVALGDVTPVRETLRRLMMEGIDRHEAIHAVASVLSEHMNELIGGALQQSDSNASYFASLAKLTVKSWRQTYS